MDTARETALRQIAADAHALKSHATTALERFESGEATIKQHELALHMTADMARELENAIEAACSTRAST